MPSPAEGRPGIDLVALGADLEPGTLLSAYRTGLFPMPIDPGRKRSKIAWYSPDPRGVLPLDELKVSKSLRRSMRRYDVTMNQAFDAVITACAEPNREGRWITPEFVGAYSKMFELGWAHSVEVWDGDELVGGLYGLRIDRFFAGEAMFHRATDASKVALVHLVDCLREAGVQLLDVQWSTPHLESLGVTEVARPDYLALLHAATHDDPEND